MKKQYLRISIAALFFAALIFGTSCSKKSSDDPKPTTTAPTTTPPATQQKQVPTTIKDKEDPKAGDGTVRESATNVTVGGTTVAVQAPTDNFKTTTLSSEGKTNLNNLLGVSNTRLAGAFDFGWYIIKAEAQIDPNSTDKTNLLDPDNNPEADSLKIVMFFDDEIPGIYYQYYYALDTEGTGDAKYWDWGTYAVDKDVETIAFDFNENNVPAEIWNIKFITSSSIVLKTTVAVGSLVVPVTVGLYGFNLQANDDTHVVSELETGLSESTWYLNSYQDAAQQTITTDYICKITSSFTIYPSFSYLFASPIPCSTFGLGYYYFKKSGNKDVIVMYYDTYTDSNSNTYTDLYIEAEVTSSKDSLSLKYISCPLIPNYVGYTFNYTNATPISSTRKE